MNQEVEIARPPNFLNRVARRKLGVSDAWELFAWERIGDTDDLLVTGGIPRLLKSGLRKGRKTWDGKGQTVAVTRSEVKAEFLTYEAESGNCHNCGGSGQEWATWSAASGNEYQQCRVCDGTGKAGAA